MLAVAAGCTNKSVSDLGESQVVHTHCFGRIVQVSQLLYCQNSAMTHMLLVSLCSHLCQEDVAKYFNAAHYFDDKSLRQTTSSSETQ